MSESTFSFLESSSCFFAQDVQIKVAKRQIALIKEFLIFCLLKQY